MISTLILTKNEERDLPACLESVSWCDDIHVYDSYSTDRTCDIARAAGANITTRPDQDRSVSFGGDESLHRNWGLENIAFKYEWVLLIDADERVTPMLAQQIKSAVKQPGQNVAFRIQRRDFFMGRWLKHVQATALYTRLFRPDCTHFERLINPITCVSGSIGDLDGYLDHFPFSKGVAHWLNRHNLYSSLEAEQIIANRLSNTTFSISKAFFARDFTERRVHQKELFYRLPARPIVKFILLYFLKRGFLDGTPGYVYAMLQSFYEFMIVLKTRELALERRARDPLK